MGLPFFVNSGAGAACIAGAGAAEAAGIIVALSIASASPSFSPPARTATVLARIIDLALSATRTSRRAMAVGFAATRAGAHAKVTQRIVLDVSCT
jgi:hypothetical protein